MMTPEFLLGLAGCALILALVVVGAVAGREFIKGANAHLDQDARDRKAAVDAELVAELRRVKEEENALREYGDRLLAKSAELKAERERLFDEHCEILRTLGYSPEALARMADPDSPEYDAAVEAVLNMRQPPLAYERTITPEQAAELAAWHALPASDGGGS